MSVREGGAPIDPCVTVTACVCVLRKNLTFFRGCKSDKGRGGKKAVEYRDVPLKRGVFVCVRASDEQSFVCLHLCVGCDKPLCIMPGCQRNKYCVP